MVNVLFALSSEVSKEYLLVNRGSHDHKSIIRNSLLRSTPIFIRFSSLNF